MLTAKRARFVSEYLKDRNGAQAAIRAGYSAKTARAIACELLTFPDVASAVESAERQLTEESGITAKKVIGELAIIAMDTEERTADRVKALELLGKHLVLFTEKHKHEGQVEMPVTVIHEHHVS